MMKMKREFSDGKKSALPSAWHPDFRNIEGLPHVAVERVIFLINVVVVVLPILFAISWGYLEIEAFVVRSRIDALRTEILERRGRNETILEQSAAYDVAAEKIEVLQHFYDTPLVPLDFLVELAQNRPSGLVLNNVSIADVGEEFDARAVDAAVIHLQGYISDTTISALEMMDSFKEILNNFDSLRGKVEDIDVVSVRRDIISKLFTYSMTIHVRKAED